MYSPASAAPLSSTKTTPRTSSVETWLFVELLSQPLTEKESYSYVSNMFRITGHADPNDIAEEHKAVDIDNKILKESLAIPLPPDIPALLME